MSAVLKYLGRRRCHADSVEPPRKKSNTPLFYTPYAGKPAKQLSMSVKRFKKLLVANRGEIAIRVLRAASELKLRTVALYTYEDRYSLHRYKADEAYQIGPDNEPLKPYLDVEAIIKLAKKKGVDAIHPGYGFLSENVNFVFLLQVF